LVIRWVSSFGANALRGRVISLLATRAQSAPLRHAPAFPTTHISLARSAGLQGAPRAGIAFASELRWYKASSVQDKRRSALGLLPAHTEVAARVRNGQNLSRRNFD